MPPDQSVRLDAPSVEGDLTRPVEGSPERRSDQPTLGRRPHGEPPPQRSWLKTIIVLLLIGGAIAAGVWRIQYVRQQAADKPTAGSRPGGGGPVPIVPGLAEEKDVPIYLDGLGTIQALNTVTIRSRVDGEIQKIGFNEGDFVEKDKPLVSLDPAPFKATLAQAAAKLTQDQAQLENARRDLKRDEDLAVRKVIADQVLDTQRSLVAQLEALVKTDQASIGSANVQLAYTNIVAPFSGRTGIRMVDVGNIVHANDATGIVVLTELQPISLIFTLPEQNLNRIYKQQKATQEEVAKAAPAGKSAPEAKSPGEAKSTEPVGLTVYAIDRDNKTVIAEGKLTVIDNQIDTTTGNVRLKAEFANKEFNLWPGQFIIARLLVETRHGAVVVPAQTVQRGPDSPFVYVLNGDTAEMRKVTVGPIQDGTAVIEKGLKGGEHIVVDGQYKLKDGSKVVLPGAQPGGGGGGGHPGGGHGGAGHKPAAQ